MKALDLNDGGSSSHSIDVLVEQGAIQARLLGGNARNVTEYGSIVLDLSNSFDEDYGSDSGGRLGFSHTCTQLLPTISEDDCNLDILSIAPFGRGYFSAIPKANTTDTVSVITFQVRALDGSRIDTVSVNIRVIPHTNPIIEFTEVFEKTNVDTKISIPALFSATEAATASPPIAKPDPFINDLLSTTF